MQLHFWHQTFEVSCIEYIILERDCLSYIIYDKQSLSLSLYSLSHSHAATQIKYQFLDGIDWKVLSFSPSNGSDLSYEAILLSPNGPSVSTPPPLVVWLHGGPHILYSIKFYAWSACFVALGFAVLIGE